eukprot:scaffold259_cov252-Pinguiococcus_pyrenoidosus.AAC.12
MALAVAPPSTWPDAFGSTTYKLCCGSMTLPIRWLTLRAAAMTSAVSSAKALASVASIWSSHPSMALPA